MIIGCLSGSGRGTAIDGSYAFWRPRADRAPCAGPAGRRGVRRRAHPFRRGRPHRRQRGYPDRVASWYRGRGRCGPGRGPGETSLRRPRAPAPAGCPRGAGARPAVEPGGHRRDRVHRARGARGPFTGGGAQGGPGLYGAGPGRSRRPAGPCRFSGRTHRRQRGRGGAGAGRAADLVPARHPPRRTRGVGRRSPRAAGVPGPGRDGPAGGSGARTESRLRDRGRAVGLPTTCGLPLPCWPRSSPSGTDWS